MRRFVTGALIAIATAGVAAPAFGSGTASSSASASSSGPTPAQIRAAIRHAENSRDLWATVNRCNAPKRGRVGVRGQMPALSFTSHLLMDIQVQYKTPQGWVDVPGPNANQLRDLGRQSKDLFQAGFTFHFQPHAGRIRGQITFTWKYNGQVIGQVTRNTTGGHTGVDFSDPPGYSRASCRVR